MDFFETVRRRKSYRGFSSIDLETESLRRILEAANSAPSAGNLQAYEIVVVSDSGKKKALAEACFDQKFIASAKLVFVFFANPERSAEYGERGEKLFCIQDATIAAAYTQLAAAANGLASVWVGAFDPEAVKKILKSPEKLIPVAVIPLGFAAIEAEKTPRRALDNLVHEDGF